MSVKLGKRQNSARGAKKQTAQQAKANKVRMNLKIGKEGPPFQAFGRTLKGGQQSTRTTH